jgi:hypothetical protein
MESLMAKRIGISIAVAMVLIGGLFLFTKLALKPMDTDLSGIGQGTPALVLAFENYSPAGADALERLNKVRGDYEDRMMVLVADLGTPDGRGFAERFNLPDGVAVFMAPDGAPVTIISIPDTEGALRQRLEATLAEVGQAD